VVSGVGGATITASSMCREVIRRTSGGASSMKTHRHLISLMLLFGIGLCPILEASELASEDELREFLNYARVCEDMNIELTRLSDLKRFAPVVIPICAKLPEYEVLGPCILNSPGTYLPSSCSVRYVGTRQFLQFSAGDYSFPMPASISGRVLAYPGDVPASYLWLGDGPAAGLGAVWKYRIEETVRVNRYLLPIRLAELRLPDVRVDEGRGLIEQFSKGSEVVALGWGISPFRGILKDPAGIEYEAAFSFANAVIEK
jgi:hypothetical protein